MALVVMFCFFLLPIKFFLSHLFIFGTQCDARINQPCYLCVNVSREFKLNFQSERILSFIPPDGSFRLMSYHIGSQSVVAIPIYVRHSLTLRSSGEQGRLDLTVGPKQTMGRALESKLSSSIYQSSL